MFTFPVAYEYRTTPPLLVPSAMNNDVSVRSNDLRDFFDLPPCAWGNGNVKKTVLIQFKIALTCPLVVVAAALVVTVIHVKQVQGALR